MMHSERQVKQLCLLLFRSQRSYLSCCGAEPLKPIGQSCLKFHGRKFHISGENMSPKYLPYMRKIFTNIQSSCRVLSSSGSVSNARESTTSSTTGEDKSTADKVNEKATSRPKMKLTAYTDNIQCSPQKAMSEYLLESSDLFHLPLEKKRSPFPEKETITMYKQKDVERMAMERWGSLEALKLEKKKRLLLGKRSSSSLFRDKGYWDDPPYSQGRKLQFDSPNEYPQSVFKDGQGKVVLFAAMVNSLNAIAKFIAWFHTGSHSMFSEFLHSVADTANQLMLALGIHQSLKQADLEHPYGWMSFRNVMSLISGVGIFCLGAGLSVYHGVIGLTSPHDIEQPIWAIYTLLGALLSEGSSILVALNQLNKSSKEQKISIKEYVIRGHETNSNVVLLEDAAAIAGVFIALGSIGFTSLGYPLADPIGSLIIGSILGGVAMFIIYSNTVMLVGRSIHPDKKLDLMNELETDRMIRTLHDVKATEMGGNFVRFKAEVDFDGREITRYYLENNDITQMLQEVREFKTTEEMESFMLMHGERIVDTLGAQVDRIETNLKRKHPEVRHVDLEQL